jgi:hypothetical protein
MPDHVDLSLSPISGAWQVMSAGSPALATQSGNGIEFVFSGLPILFFNIAVLTDRDLSSETLSSRLPTQQRRGFAEAAMRHALDVAAEAHGEQPTVLHATDVGRPLYARMGYEAISSHVCFIEKPFVEGY